MKKHEADSDFHQILEKQVQRKITSREVIQSAKKKNEKVFFTQATIFDKKKKVKINSFFNQEEEVKEQKYQQSQFHKQMIRMKTKQPFTYQNSLRTRKSKLSMVDEEAEFRLPKKNSIQYNQGNNTQIPEDIDSQGEEEKLQDYQQDSFQRNYVDFESLGGNRKNSPQIEVNSFQDEAMFENSGNNFRQKSDFSKNKEQKPKKRQMMMNLQIKVDNLDSYNSNKRSEKEEDLSSFESSQVRAKKQLVRRPKLIPKPGQAKRVQEKREEPLQTPTVLKKRQGLQRMAKSLRKQAQTAAKQTEKTKFFKPKQPEK